MALTKDQLLQMTKSSWSPTPAGQEGDRQSYATNPVTGKRELLYRIGLTDENGQEIFVPESMLQDFRNAENAAYGDSNKWNTRFDNLIPGLKPGNTMDQRYWHSVESPSSIGGSDVFGDKILPAALIAGVGALSGGFGLAGLGSAGAGGGEALADYLGSSGAYGLDSLASAAASGAATGGAGAMSQLAGADAIETMINAVNATGAATAQEAATKLGFSSIESALASVNPSWVTNAATAATVANAAAKGAASAATKGAGMFGLPADLSTALTQAGVNLGIAGISKALFGGDDGSDAAKASVNAANTTANIAAEQWDYYKKNYEPVNTALIKEAMAAGGPEDVARAEGEANAANTAAFNRAGQQTASRMQSFGLNPASPAYQSGMGSIDLAEGASGVGARTTAANNARTLGYAKKLDVANMGRGIPSASASSAATAANAGLNASNLAFRQNQTNMTNVGYGLEPVRAALGKSAATWFDAPKSDPAWGSSWKDSIDYAGPQSSGLSFSENPMGWGYKDGGMVFTPHMKPRGPVKYYADGGLVPEGGNVIDNETGEVIGEGDGESDSIPAEIDGAEPAALSNGEFVMNAQVPKLTGEEILTAINDAGLRKRGDTGLEPQSQTDAGYADGGRVGMDQFGGRYADSLQSPLSLKGKGYFGELPTSDGRSATELSSAFTVDGKTIEHPLIVPTLTKTELDHLTNGGEPTREIYEKAQSWAMDRIKRGLNPFAGPNDLRPKTPMFRRGGRITRSCGYADAGLGGE